MTLHRITLVRADFHSMQEGHPIWDLSWPTLLIMVGR